MGMFDTVGERHIQIKNLPRPYLRHFSIGDGISLADGIYFGHEGWFIVHYGKVFMEGDLDKVFDKHGYRLEIDTHKNNPVAKAIEQIRKEREED